MRDEQIVVVNQDVPPSQGVVSVSVGEVTSERFIAEAPDGSQAIHWSVGGREALYEWHWKEGPSARPAEA